MTIYCCSEIGRHILTASLCFFRVSHGFAETEEHTSSIHSKI